MGMQIKSNVDGKEAQAYVDYVQEKHHRKIEFLTIEAEGDFVNLTYKFEEVPFERIRRITGYLVGTMDHWNDAKTSEEKDRMKHEMTPSGRDIGVL